MDDASEASGDVTAAELALGLLEGDDGAAALRRMLAEPAFAVEVERWRTRFAPLFAETRDTAPREAVFDRIEHSIAPRPAAIAAPRHRNWAWPSLAAISSLAAALLLAILLNMPPPPHVSEPAPAVRNPLAAAIVPTKTGDALSAVYEPNSATLRLTSATLADARHAAELWVIGGDGVPHSLGLLRGGAVTTLTVALADLPRLDAGAVLAVSVEPIGGSPTGLPTGPVVAKGILART